MKEFPFCVTHRLFYFSVDIYNDQLRISQEDNAIVGILKKALIFVLGDGELLAFLFGQGLNDISIEGRHDEYERNAKSKTAALF